MVVKRYLKLIFRAAQYLAIGLNALGLKLEAPALAPICKYGAVAAKESRVQRKALDKKHLAPVAQLDRALPSGGRGCWFDPSRAHL